MPMFQFTAVTSAGQQQNGRIEANTREEAMSAIEQHGLRPLEVFPSIQFTAAPDRPIASTPLVPGDPGNPSARSSESNSSTRKPQRGGGGSKITLVLSGLAVVIALVALGIVLFRNPLGRGLKNYDLSTAESSFRSQLEMRANHDILAILEYEDMRRGVDLKERLKTLKVEKERHWDGNTLLFISYDEEGEKKFDVVALKKDDKTKVWQESYIREWDIRQQNSELAEEMERWEQQGPPSRGFGGSKSVTMKKGTSRPRMGPPKGATPIRP